MKFFNTTVNIYKLQVTKKVIDALQEWISMVETYQDFDIIGGKETSRSPTSASVPLTVHLLHRGHNIPCSQTQLSWTLCVCTENTSAVYGITNINII